jgi:hypothetical protein
VAPAVVVAAPAVVAVMEQEKVLAVVEEEGGWVKGLAGTVALMGPSCSRCHAAASRVRQSQTRRHYSPRPSSQELRSASSA